MANIKQIMNDIERCTCHVPDACRDCSYDKGHPFNECVEMMLKDVLELLKEQQQKKSKEEVLLAIIGKQSYTDLEKFKQLEELNDEYFNGMLDSIRAVEKLFDDH